MLGDHPATTTVSITGLAVRAERGLQPARIALIQSRPGVAVRMLTSGTTGPPKRVDLTYDMLAHSVMGAEADQLPAPGEVRRGVAIVNSPLVHIGGVFRILQCVAEARPFVLLERFELDRWAEAVRAYRPRAVSLVPAALRMVLHSDLAREDLASIRAVTSGTAPLSPDDSDAFTEKYGIPVLTSYAATEFGGGVAGWTLADHQTYWRAKRGSVGRANRGAQLRVVDDGGAPLEARRGRPAGGEARTTRTGRQLDAHHRHGPHRCRRVSVDHRPGRPGHHPRWLQGDARRRSQRGGKSSRRSRRRGGRATRRSPRRDTGGHGGTSEAGIDGCQRHSRLPANSVGAL